jgi:hypothetical protein|nr:MAG TPA: hypothetical protein [Caudoviricetes sp.]
MLKHLFDTLYSSVKKDIMYQKMKKEIMDLPAHKITSENELVRVKDRDGFIIFYAILIKDGYAFYMEKNYLKDFREDILWPLMSTYKFGRLTKDVSAKKLWKTNLRNVDITENRCVLASQE